MRVVKIYNDVRGWWETNCSSIPHAHETPHRVGYFCVNELDAIHLESHGNKLIDVTIDDLHKLIEIRNDLNRKIDLIKSVMIDEIVIDKDI